MYSLDFFRRRGLLLRREFVARDICGEICSLMRDAGQEEAEVYGSSATAVNLSIRTAWEVALADVNAADVAQRMAALRPELADHFGVTLGACEEPTFLMYRTGGFYRPHRDRATRSDESAGAARARQVSIVLFLNDDYAGGALVLYGLVDGAAWRDYGFAVTPEPGLLIAFPSDLLHEVTSVISGERYTVVSWFPA